jgi:hypothetical protein
LWRPPTISNHQSTVSKELKFKKSINSLNPKKSSGYDLITGQVLKELPIIAIKYLTKFFNAVLLKGYFPVQRKVFEHQQIQKKSAATALNTVLASVHT